MEGRKEGTNEGGETSPLFCSSDWARCVEKERKSAFWRAKMPKRREEKEKWERKIKMKDWEGEGGERRGNSRETRSQRQVVGF